VPDEADGNIVNPLPNVNTVCFIPTNFRKSAFRICCMTALIYVIASRVLFPARQSSFCRVRIPSTGNYLIRVEDCFGRNKTSSLAMTC
jgi:hypothetical protein